MMYFEDWTADTISSIKRTCVPSGDLPPDHVFALFIYTCKKTGLDPILKEIFLQKRSSWNDRAQKWEDSWQTMVSRDGYLAAAHRTGELRGIETKIYPEDVSQPSTHATCRVWRQGWEHPVEVTVAFDEYVEIDRKTGKRRSMWKDAKDGGKPRTMIGKVAESQALRRAFSYHGTYSEDELPTLESQSAGQAPALQASPSSAALTISSEPVPASPISLASPEPARVLSFKDRAAKQAAALSADPDPYPPPQGYVRVGSGLATEIVSQAEYNRRAAAAKTSIQAAITHRDGLPVHPMDDEVRPNVEPDEDNADVPDGDGERRGVSASEYIPLRDQVLEQIGRLHPKTKVNVGGSLEKPSERRVAICDTLHAAFGLDVRPADLERLAEILDGLAPTVLQKGLGILTDAVEAKRQELKP